MHCLLLLSSRRWVCALSGSVRGRASEFRDAHSKASRSIAEPEGLPYAVEIMNPSGAFVDEVLATTTSASIGFAAYYAAVREFPDRIITLRHKNSVVARWSSPNH
jgi:hypothetical protein